MDHGDRVMTTDAAVVHIASWAPWSILSERTTAWAPCESGLASGAPLREPFRESSSARALSRFGIRGSRAHPLVHSVGMDHSVGSVRERFGIGGSRAHPVLVSVGTGHSMGSVRERFGIGVASV